MSNLTIREITIKLGGQKKTALLLGVHHITVNRWVMADKCPRATRMLLERLAKVTEHEIQRELIRICVLHEHIYPELRHIFAIPNGGHRHIAVAVKLKAEGAKRGVPDLCLPVARRGSHSLWIEMKTQKGRLSTHQKEFIGFLQLQGHRVEVCRSAAEAWNTIQVYLEAE